MLRAPRHAPLALLLAIPLASLHVAVPALADPEEPGAIELSPRTARLGDPAPVLAVVPLGEEGEVDRLRRSALKRKIVGGILLGLGVAFAAGTIAIAVEHADHAGTDMESLSDLVAGILGTMSAAALLSGGLVVGSGVAKQRRAQELEARCRRSFAPPPRMLALGWSF